MRFIAIALLLLVIFIAVWLLFVAPAEKRYHERKLEVVRKKIENRATAEDGDSSSGDPRK